MAKAFLLQISFFSLCFHDPDEGIMSDFLGLIHRAGLGLHFILSLKAMDDALGHRQGQGKDISRSYG
jgi:hypothetical protein